MRTIHVLGVPFRTGSLYPGSEDDAKPLRAARLIERLQAAGGCRAQDDADVAIPSYLPHHTVPPIRNWPGPRIAWDCVSDRLEPILREPEHVPLLIGCDCSVVIGTTQALARATGDDIHVIYVDGDFDDAAPDPARCQSAAASAVWLLTHESPFWVGPPLRPSQVTVVGWTAPSQTKQPGIGSVSLVDIRRDGPETAGPRVLDAIPASARILVHLDIDVFRQRDLPAAYFPHRDGLSLAEGTTLVRALLRDARVRLVEVAEYAALSDVDHRSADHVVDLLCAGLGR
jgi:arginase